MENSRIKKASWNIAWLIVYQITIFACNLVVPRLIITTYGSAYNGMISSITQFLNFVSILRLGVAGATRVSLYKTLAEGDVKGTSAIINATERYMRRIGYVIVVYIAILATAYPLYIQSEDGFFSVAILVIAIGIGTFAQYFFGITYQTLLQADQRLYIYNGIQTVATILNTFLTVFLIMQGFTIQTVKLVSAIVFFVSPIVLNIYVTQKYSIDKSCPPNNQALNRKGDVMGHSIANIIHENTDMIVLTLFCDVKVVSVYSVYNLIVSGLKQIMSIFTTGIEAVFGNMWAKGEMESIKRNLSYFEYLMTAFVSVVFGATSMLILPFVKLYTKNVTDIEYVIPLYAAVIVLAQAFYCIRMPYLTLVQAAGHYKETKNGAYFEAILNIVSSVVLVQFIGILGTAIGTLLANVFRTLQYSTYVSDYLVKRDKSIVLKRIIWIGLNVVVADLLCANFVEAYAGNSWLTWVISGFGCVIISCVICLITSLVFYRNDLRGIANILLRMVHMKDMGGKKA